MVPVSEELATAIANFAEWFHYLCLLNYLRGKTMEINPTNSNLAGQPEELAKFINLEAKRRISN